MYYAYTKWETDAVMLGAKLCENRRRTLATVKGVVVGRWDKHTKTGELRKTVEQPRRRRR